MPITGGSGSDPTDQVEYKAGPRRGCVAQWLAVWSRNRKFAGSSPDQGTCRGSGLCSLLGCVQEAASWCFFSFPLSQKGTK